MLLGTACPETSLEALAQLSIGQRDTLLLMLREWLFGSQLVGVATCPKCGDRIELSFQVSDIQATTTIESVREFSLSIDGYEICFRLPNSADLTALPAANCKIPNLDRAVETSQFLLERCLLKIVYQGKVKKPDQLPPEVEQKVIEQMALEDPQADVQLNLFCPTCNHQWQSAFDIVSFFWSEIHTWAQRTLREIHALASVYGWRESEILALSPGRRQLYMEIIGK
ncbi:MAG: hypothetical protein AB4050_06695 [Synechococcus sp.]